VIELVAEELLVRKALTVTFRCRASTRESPDLHRLISTPSFQYCVLSESIHPHSTFLSPSHPLTLSPLHFRYCLYAEYMPRNAPEFKFLF
jgi:hypothetical protein